MPIGASTTAIYLSAKAGGAERSRAPPLRMVSAMSRTEVAHHATHDGRAISRSPHVLEREREEDDLEGVRTGGRVRHRQGIRLRAVVLELRLRAVVGRDLVLELVVDRRLVQREAAQQVTDRCP